MIKTIVKRDGTKEPFSPKKLNGWGLWASEKLGNTVDWSEVVLHIASTSKDEVTSVELHNMFISYCLTKRSFDYNRMAGRLYIAYLNKELYGDKYPTVKELLTKLSNHGLVSKDFLEAFTDDEYVQLEKIIDHSIDLNYAHYQIEQAMEKYSLRDRVTGQYFETPQFSALRVAMQMCKNRKNRIERIKRHYNQIKSDILNVPTPYYTNSGTSKLGLASCCLHESDDYVGSLATGNHISYMMTVNSAGQGTKIRTRTIDDPVRGGAIPHQGKKPYLRAEVGMINANLQNGRGGAESTSFDIIDPEIEQLLVLKNPMTPAARQIRGLDYSIGFNKWFAKKAANNEDWNLFSYGDVPDLYEALYATDDTFEKLYNKYVKQGKSRGVVKARDILRLMLTEGVGVGRIYQENLFELNNHTPFITDGSVGKGKVRQSNLCVAPETMILTDKGYEMIGELEDQDVVVWNGKEWSETTVRKTGVNQKLIKVTTSFNQTIECTPEHKFYVQVGSLGRGGKIYEKRANELKTGDRLIKFDLPIIEGNTDLDFAYSNGFYSGDGCCYKGKQMSYLYHGKQSLLDKLEDVKSIYVDVNQNRTIVTHNGNLKDKYFVPTTNYTIESRVNWLAGLCDSDGTVSRNGETESLQIGSIHLSFLQEIQLMLQTLGITSTINSAASEGYREMPLNNGTGESGLFYCQQSYRLLINATGLFKLSELGFETHRLEWKKRRPNRECDRFVTIKSVVDEGRYDDTLCFTEPKRHMGMFNGILTGQCLEIGLITQAYNSVSELYVYGDLKNAIQNQAHPSVIEYLKQKNEVIEGEVAVCSLAGINVGKFKHKVGTPEWDEEYREATFVALDMVYTAIQESDYPLPHIEYTAKKRMSAGVGIVDLAHLMAKYKLKYDSQEGRDLIHKVAESHYWHLLNASLELSKEFGNAEWMDKTKWVNGWLPLDTYNKNVDEVVTTNLQYDWEGLRKKIIENGGHAFSVLVAHMPAESSSVRSGATNGVYPVRDLDLNKTNDTNVVKYVVPESDKLGKHYQNAYEIDVEDMAKVYGILQKWTDQGISADQWYKAQGSDKIKSSDLMRGWFSWVYYGVKTRYYINTLTAKGVDLNVELVDNVPQGEYQPDSNTDCEGCKL